MLNGWEVSQPIVDEAYDIVACHPVITNGQFVKIQVKTVRIREDRGSAVIYAKKSDGKPYTLEDCDFIIGVLDTNVYMLPNRGIGEYWVPVNSISWDLIE